MVKSAKGPLLNWSPYSALAKPTLQPNAAYYLQSLLSFTVGTDLQITGSVFSYNRVALIKDR